MFRMGPLITGRVDGVHCAPKKMPMSLPDKLVVAAQFVVIVAIKARDIRQQLYSYVEHHSRSKTILMFVIQSFSIKLEDRA